MREEKSHAESDLTTKLQNCFVIVHIILKLLESTYGNAIILIVIVKIIIIMTMIKTNLVVLIAAISTCCPLATVSGTKYSICGKFLISNESLAHIFSSSVSHTHT